MLASFGSRSSPAEPAGMALVRPLKAAIAGTLSPFVLSVDGKVVLRAEGRHERVELNGVPVPTTGQGDKRTFFLTTGAETLEVSTVDSTGRKYTFLPIALPALRAAAIRNGEIVLQLSVPVEAVKVDGNPLSLAGGYWVGKLPRAGPGETHAVEVVGGTERPGRSYNLRVETRIETAGRAPTAAPVAMEEQPVTRPARRALSLAEFQLGTVLVHPQQGNVAFTIEGWWTPTWSLSDHWALRLGLGLIPVQQTSTPFHLVTQYEAGVRVRLGERFALDAGGGGSTWIGNGGGTRPVVSAMVSLFMEPIGEKRVLQRLYLGYSYLPDTNPIDMVRLGLGLAF